jgi:hypothetical protein
MHSLINAISETEEADAAWAAALFASWPMCGSEGIVRIRLAVPGYRSNGASSGSNRILQSASHEVVTVKVLADVQVTTDLSFQTYSSRPSS